MMLLLAANLLLAAETAPGSFSAVLPERPAAPGTHAAPTDTLTRVPGSALRLGWSLERASALGTFKPGSASGDATNREGELRWFGSPASARLTFRSGRLAEVRFDAKGVSARLTGYASDELRRQGYRRVSHTLGGGTDVSQWQGRASVKLTASPNNLTAEVTPVVAPEPAALTPAAGEPAATQTAAAATPPAGSAPPAELDFTRATIADSLPAPRRTFAPPDPPRPQIAVDAGVFGRVQVRAHVDVSGQVIDAAIERGIPELNQAALGWASTVKFEPYLHDGRPAPFAILIPVTFSTRPAGARTP